MIDYFLNLSFLLWLGVIFTIVGVLSKEIGHTRSVFWWLGISCTVIGILITGSATILSSLNQDKQQLALMKKTNEIAELNREIAENQKILSEKAENQTKLQERLTEKSEENALLNSQMGNLQLALRKKAEDQITSQIFLRKNIEEYNLQNSNLASIQSQQSQIIYEMKDEIFNLRDSLKDAGIIKDRNQRNSKNANVRLQGVSGVGYVGVFGSSGNLYQTGENISISNGETKHTFGGDLSFKIKIKSKGNGRPFLHAMFVSPGNDVGRIETDSVGFCVSYVKYTIKVKEISSESATILVSTKNLCRK